MNNKIEWFNNGAKEPYLEYLAIKDNHICCRVKREESSYWVARNIEGGYLFSAGMRHDVFDKVEDKFNV